MSTPIRDVAIVGGGFSGTLLAINLLRHHGPHATLIERGERIGPGVAYSTTRPEHLLNVRAANMSALPDDPDNFVRWLGERGFGDAGPFVPRAVYGRYLAELLEQAQRQAPGRLTLVQAGATAFRPGTPATVSLDTGATVTADAAVLALGNLPPRLPGNLDPAILASRRYLSDPWAADLAARLTGEDHVLVLGTGLTMIDVALSLDASGFRGRITALSRRGLIPLEHAAGPAVASELGERPSAEVSLLLRTVRERAAAVGWRAAVDELRPYTQSMWLAASPEQRRRFLRHLRPWWDIHRHRLAPPVARRLAALRAEGRLQIAAGRALALAEREDGLAVIWRPRGARASRELFARYVINCTGPQSDLARATDPLLVQLARDGHVVPDPLGLGLVVDPQARVIGAGGGHTARLFALGPMSKGTFWEITAVPDIRVQAWNLARYLSNAYWIGGEGL